jgi:hypothetical protein
MRLFGLSVVASLAFACGGTAAQPAQSAQPHENLIVTVSAVDPSLTLVWATQQAGYFENENLTVEIKAVGAGQLGLLVADQADLGIQSPSGVLLPVNSGKETTILFANSGRGIGGFMAAGPNIQKVTDCKRVATLALGSAVYAWTTVYKKAFGANYEIVSVNDLPSEVALITSGSTDCAISSYAAFSPGLDSGKLHLIVDPRNPSTLPAAVSQQLNAAVEGSVFGLTEHVKQRKGAIQRFMRAYLKGLSEIIQKQSASQIAALLRKSPDWQPIAQEKLAPLMDITKFSWAPNGGYISKSQWTTELQWIAGGGTSLGNLDDPKWAYDRRVDMSLFLAAGGKATS